MKKVSDIKGLKINALIGNDERARCSCSVLGRNLVLGARARARQNRSAQCSFFQGARALSMYRALSHNFSGIEVFIQKCLYF